MFDIDGGEEMTRTPLSVVPNEAVPVDVPSRSSVPGVAHSESEAGIEDLSTIQAADAIADLGRRTRLLGAERLRLAVTWADRHVPRCRQGGPAPRNGEGCPCLVPGTIPDWRRGARECRWPGNDGTPAVSASGLAEFGVLSQTSSASGARFLGDALDLRHRHPRLWRRVMAGEVEDWQARRVVHLAVGLTRSQALEVDAATADALGRLPWGRALATIEAAVVAADPQGHEERRREAERRRYVSAGRYRGTNSAGLRTLVAQTVAGDVARVDALIGYVAGLLAAMGDHDSVDVRRAKAFGLLANPAQLCILMSFGQEVHAGLAATESADVPRTTQAGAADELAGPRTSGTSQDERADIDETPEPEEPGVASAVQLASAIGDMFRRQGAEQGIDAWARLRPPTSLVFHLSPGSPVVRMSETDSPLGPIGLAQLRDLLSEQVPGVIADLLRAADPAGPADADPTDPIDPTDPAARVGARTIHRRRVRERPPRLRDEIVVRPVLDIAGQVPVDAYEVPTSMRSALTESSPYEVFPWGTADARASQMDHTETFDHGSPGVDPPPAQTRPENLGPLSASHHNLKTHHGWRCHQPLPGLYLWQTLSGHWFRIDHNGSVALGRETPAILRQRRSAHSHVEAVIGRMLVDIA